MNIETFDKQAIIPDPQQAINIASVIKSEMSQSGYARLREKLLEDEKVKLPTHYMLSKSIPKIVPFIIRNDDNKNPWYDSPSHLTPVSINETSEPEATLEPKVEYTPSSFINHPSNPNPKVEFADAFEKCIASSKKL